MGQEHSSEMEQEHSSKSGNLGQRDITGRDFKKMLNDNMKLVTSSIAKNDEFKEVIVSEIFKKRLLKDFVSEYMSKRDVNDLKAVVSNTLIKLVNEQCDRERRYDFFVDEFIEKLRKNFERKMTEEMKSKRRETLGKLEFEEKLRQIKLEFEGGIRQIKLEIEEKIRIQIPEFKEKVKEEIIEEVIQELLRVKIVKRPEILGNFVMDMDTELHESGGND
jgi:hypothetical protein